jgi:hypothetical protein
MTPETLQIAIQEKGIAARGVAKGMMVEHSWESDFVLASFEATYPFLVRCFQNIGWARMLSAVRALNSM